MNLDFSKLNIEERPSLILETLNFTPIAVMGDAYGLNANIAYNEVSEIEFTVPHYADGRENAYFDQIQSMRIVEVQGLGRFRLVSPATTLDGISEIKVCKGYSLESELAQKTLNLPDGTYNLWNPLKPEGTILGMFFKDFPAWRVNHETDGVLSVEVSASLIDKYRTFSSSDNWYNFFKSTAQQTYQCVFEFDPFERIIKVRAAKDDAIQLPVMIATENLAKEIKVEEQTDAIQTCLDVYGASDVDIRSVNPTGTNKIYNLEYYMNEMNFPQLVRNPDYDASVEGSQEYITLIEKYHNWHKKIANIRDEYYTYTIQRANAYTERELIRAELVELQSDYTTQENLYAAAAQMELGGTEMNPSSKDYRAKMNQISKDIKTKELELESAQARIDSITEILDAASNALAFDVYFADELVDLSPYIKESVLTESTFVATNTVTYGTTGALLDGKQITVKVDNAVVTDATNSTDSDSVLASNSNMKTYRADGGQVEITSKSVAADGAIVTTVIRGDVQHAVYNIQTLENSTYKLIASIVFEKEVVNEDGSKDKVTATLTVAQNEFNEAKSMQIKTTFDYDDPTTDSMYDYSGYVYLNDLMEASAYLTSESTEYQRSSVQWELYDYAWDLLTKSAYPSYSFSVDCANFLTLDDFIAFKNQFELGQRVYLQLREGEVISPIVIGAKFDYDNPESLTLEFANQFNSNSGEFALLDILEQSVSLGGTVDSSKLSWNSWQDTQASTVVGDYMKSELDLALQRIMASTDQEIVIDGSGIHCRKRKDANSVVLDSDDEMMQNSEYDRHQIWISNDTILFTDDGWQTARMAIGQGTMGYGIIADYLIGSFVASEKLLITNAAGTVTINDNGVVVDGMHFLIKNSKDDTTGTLIDLMSASSTYKQDAAPEDPKEGDLWFCTGETTAQFENGKWYRYNEETAAWEKLTDSEIENINKLLDSVTNTDEDGNSKLNLGSVAGVLNTTISGMTGTAGNLYMDDSGLWLIDTDSPKTATKAVWMNGSGILIADSRKSSDSSDPSYNENNHSSFMWRTAINGSSVAADTFVGSSIFGEIELGIGSATSGGFPDSNGNRWNFYVDSDGQLHAQDAEVKGDVWCDNLYVDDENIMKLLRGLKNNIADTNAGLELSNTELDIKFTRSGSSITTVGGGITFTDITGNENATRGNAGSLGADIAASSLTGLGLATEEGYPIVFSSGGNMSLDTAAGSGIFIGNHSSTIQMGLVTGITVSIGGNNSTLYLKGKTIEDWVAGAGGGTAVYA